MEEIWRYVKDFENYMVSNRGRVKKIYKHAKEKILKPFKDKGGYCQVHLTNKETHKVLRIHLLVWDAFGLSPRNGRILQVDHIDNNKENNCIENLQLLSQRENISKMHLTKNKTSKYTGICIHSQTKKWRATIFVNKKQHHIGCFDTEEEAHQAYINFKNTLI